MNGWGQDGDGGVGGEIHLKIKEYIVNISELLCAN